MTESPAPDYFVASMMTPDQSAATPAPLEGKRGKETKVAEAFKVKYKTEICKNWRETGVCEFQASCSFAHGDHELLTKVVPKNYKTKQCKKFHKDLFCPYGERCQFIHDKAAAMAARDEAANVIGVRVAKPRAHRRRLQDEISAAEPLLTEVRSSLRAPAKRLSCFEGITEM